MSKSYTTKRAVAAMLAVLAIGGGVAMQPYTSLGNTAIVAHALDMNLGDFTASLSGSVITITGYTGSATSITLPVESGYTMKIGTSAFEGNTKIKTVTIPNGYTEIGSWSFSECTALTTVTFNSSVSTLSTIGARAFNKCTALTKVANIPTSLSSIGSYAFQNCSKLTDLGYLTTHNQDFKNNSKLKTIGSYAFAGTGITAYKPNANLTTVGTGAFANCSSLAQIDFDYAPKLTSIPDKCCLNCKSLRSFYLPYSVTSIGLQALYNCSSILTVFGSYTNVAMPEKGVFPVIEGFSDALGGTTGVTYRVRPNNRLFNTLKTMGVSASDIEMFDASGNADAKAINDGTHTGSANWFKWTNLQLPLPGVKYNPNGIKDPTNMGSKFTVTKKECIDASTGNALSSGSFFKNNTAYYYQLTLEPKAGYYFDFYNASKKYEFDGVATVGTEQASVFYAVGTATSGTNLVVKIYPQENVISGYATTGASNVAGTVSLNTKTSDISLHKLKACTATSTENSITITNPYDNETWYGYGAPACFYGYKKTSASEYTWSPSAVIKNLADAKYNIRVAVKTGSSSFTDIQTLTAATTPVATLKTASVSFGGLLGLNYRTALSDSIKNSARAYFYHSKWTWQANENAQTDSNGDKIWSTTVNAKEMNDTIKFCITNAQGVDYMLKKSDGTRVENDEHEYSVMSYLNAVIKSSSNAKMVALAKATKDYGICAQKYFNYNTEGLEAVSDEINACDTTDFAKYAVKTSGTKPSVLTGVTFTGVFEADTTLRVYYKSASDLTSGCTFKVDGKNVTVQKDSSGYYIEVKNIAAKDLDKTHTFSITSGGKTFTVTASILSYCNSLKATGKATSILLAKSLYLYNQKAKAYFA